MENEFIKEASMKIIYIYYIIYYFFFYIMIFG